MITHQDIKALKEEASRAGDTKMVSTCNRALMGSARARKMCEKVIEAAKAQLEEKGWR
jgi:hypothetical protein